MRLRLAFLALALLCLEVACREEQLPPPIDHPRLTPNVRMQDVNFHSVSLQRGMPYRAILPANLPHNQKLPVIYLLHGGGGGYRDWSNYSDVARFSEQGLVLIMPEASSSYYVNAAERPQDRYEDYITKDQISDVESRFPTASDRDHRAIVGVSMGGFGAIVLGLKHPDLFAFAAGMSSALDVPTRPFAWRRMGQYRAHAKIFVPWGSASRSANNPYQLAESADPATAPYLYLTCGEQEGLLSANQRFATLLRKHRFNFEFHPGPGGHDWNQWNGRLPELGQILRHRLATN